MSALLTRAPSEVDDAFAPLPPVNRSRLPGADEREVWEAIVPAPHEPELPRGASAMWVYRDAEGHPLCARFRVEKKGGGKDILPLTYGRRVWTDRRGVRRDETGWHWKQGPKPLPLYGLDRLTSFPDAPVLLVEGEKTADAAALLFPDLVVMTSQGGSKAAANNDWSPLLGRDVTLWPDNDEPGQQWADDVILHLRDGGTTSVRQVVLPKGLPAAWDLADALPEGMAEWGEETAFLRATIDRAPLASSNVTMPPGYTLDAAGGLAFMPPAKGDDDFPTKIWISAFFEVIAETNDGAGYGWGLLIRWRDRDSRLHEWAIPKRLVHGDGKDLAGQLEDAGLNCSISATRLLRQFIASVRTKARLRCVDRAGWHRTDESFAFILPGGSTIGDGRRSVVFQSSRATSGREFGTAGTLEEWQTQVAAYAVGNSRLGLFLAAAFAGPLLDILGEQSGGIHLVGKSQSGKSTSAFIAGSVWGQGDREGQIRAWRGTANGLESVASETSDTVLILDEMGQADAREVGEVVYMLANNTGKQRASRSGDARARRTWRSFLLSTGEVTLAAKMNEAGKKVMAGQEVRLVNISADAGKKMGAFEELHDIASPGELADHLRVASRTYYGTASRRFLGELARDRQDNPQKLDDVLRALRQRFDQLYLPEGAKIDGQVRSVAARFSLIAAAGELATDYGVLPWRQGEAMQAAGKCFRNWLAERGGVGAREDTKAIEQVRAFIEKHGESRFTNLSREDRDLVGGLPESKTINRAGFKRRVQAPEGERWEYLFLPEEWKADVCKGLDASEVAKVLRDAGYLLADAGRNLARKIVIPDHGRIRLYVVSGSILGGGDD